MDKDHKILIIAFLLLGISLFASQFQAISGKAIKRDCQIASAAVTPRVGKPGDLFEINFFSNIESAFGADYNGIELPVYINRAPPGKDCSIGERVDSFRKLDGCNGNNCESGRISLITLPKEVSPLWLPGEYCITAIDRCT